MLSPKTSQAGKIASRGRVLQGSEARECTTVLDRASNAARREICREFARLSLSGLSSGNCHAAGARHINDADIADHIHKIINLRGSAGNFHTQLFGAYGYEFAVENFNQLDNLRLLFRSVGSDLEKRQLAFNEIFAAQAVYLDHFDQFIELFFDLFDHSIIAAGNNDHARYFGIAGGIHRQ